MTREDEEKKADLGKLIQSWNRFVLQQLHQVCSHSLTHYGCVCVSQETQPLLCGEDGEGGRKSVVERLFGCAVESVSVCQCGWRSSRRNTELLFSLTYPGET